MSVPMRCQSYIFDSFSEACSVMEILNVRYPLALVTATTGRLLSVGIIATEWSESEVDALVQGVHEEVRSSDRFVPIAMTVRSDLTMRADR